MSVLLAIMRLVLMLFTMLVVATACVIFNLEPTMSAVLTGIIGGLVWLNAFRKEN